MKQLKLLLTITAFFIYSFSFGQFNIAQGKTTVNEWQNYAPGTTNPVTGGNLGGIYVDVNTANCKFKETPQYIVSVEGGRLGGHWLLSGASSIYNATPNGFRVYLTWTDYSGHPGANNPVNVQDAKKYGWFIRWTAISTSGCDCK